MTKEEFLKIVEEEGNYYEWIQNGIKCTIERSPLNLHWNGYIFLEEIHYFYKNVYEDLLNINVHGGITYSDINEDGLYKIGFDCNHSYDIGLISFEMGIEYFIINAVYRTKDIDIQK